MKNDKSFMKAKLQTKLSLSLVLFTVNGLFLISCMENNDGKEEVPSNDDSKVDELLTENKKLRWENTRLSLKIRTVESSRLVKDKRTNLWHYDVERTPFTGRAIELRPDQSGLILEAFFLNGERDGVEKVWHRNGKLNTESQWFGGKKNGVFNRWDENGMLISKEYFKAGKPVPHSKQ